jgi:2-C-methyl-D-erythritol 2,4-cyclodiphosphate synthase
MRVGQGYDVHALVTGRRLVIGGVEIPHAKGLAGYSDADVLLHAICDALLGAAALGDIGWHYPDTNPQYSGANSREMLRATAKKVAAAGYRIVNVDATIIAQEPRMAPHVATMIGNIASDLGLQPAAVSVKATTTEKLGWIGRGEGIAAQAIALIE